MFGGGAASGFGPAGSVGSASTPTSSTASRRPLLFSGNAAAAAAVAVQLQFLAMDDADDAIARLAERRRDLRRCHILVDQARDLGTLAIGPAPPGAAPTPPMAAYSSSTSSTGAWRRCPMAKRDVGCMAFLPGLAFCLSGPTRRLGAEDNGPQFETDMSAITATCWPAFRRHHLPYEHRLRRHLQLPGQRAGSRRRWRSPCGTPPGAGRPGRISFARRHRQRRGLSAYLKFNFTDWASRNFFRIPEIAKRQLKVELDGRNIVDVTESRRRGVNATNETGKPYLCSGRQREAPDQTQEEKMVDQQIGQRIALIRTKAGLISEPSPAISASPPLRFIKWEKGSGMTHYNLTRICDAYEISLEWLVTGVGLPRRSFENRRSWFPPQAYQREGHCMMDTWLKSIETEMRTNQGERGEDDQEE